jgi:F-type H+-transporting ATPase subunit epsilon
MAKSIHCKLVTPAAALLDDQVVYARVPLHDGLMGFQPGRAPILAKLGIGELRLDTAKGSRTFLVEDGFIKMAENELTILAERAIPQEDLKKSDGEAELKVAENAPPPSGDTPAQRLASQAKRSRSIQRAKLKISLAKA